MVNTSACKIIVSFLCLFKYDFSLCVNHLSNIVVFMTKVGIRCYIILFPNSPQDSLFYLGLVSGKWPV